mgnify:CR=1
RINLIDEGGDVPTVPRTMGGYHVLSDLNGQFEFNPHTQKIIELQVMLSIMDFGMKQLACARMIQPAQLLNRFRGQGQLVATNTASLVLE